MVIYQCSICGYLVTAEVAEGMKFSLDCPQCEASFSLVRRVFDSCEQLVKVKYPTARVVQDTITQQCIVIADTPVSTFKILTDTCDTPEQAWQEATRRIL